MEWLVFVLVGGACLFMGVILGILTICCLIAGKDEKGENDE